MGVGEVIGVITTAVLAVLGYFVKGAIDHGKYNGMAIIDLKVDIAKNYVSKEDLGRHLEDLTKRFDRVESKIDTILSRATHNRETDNNG